MKICILTQALYTNYGGILQAFALQSVLKQMGHEVWTLDRLKNETPLFVKILSIVKRLALFILYHNPKVIRAWPTSKERNIIEQHTIRFIEENIITTEKIGAIITNSLLKKYGFEAYIIGSDQVWRPKYSPCITNYFLDFLDKDDNAKRIAYAASFGVSNWEFTSKQTAQCAILARSFDAISVREDTAVEMCKIHLGVKALHVLDPTMLLIKEDYIKLVEKDNISKSKGALLTYILDKSSDNKEIISKVTKELDLNPFSVIASKQFHEVGRKQIESCILPPLTELIRGFMDADYVVTDSFHGTIFSIIFNKPFISIGNTKRGLARFTSLLKIFGLEDRLILTLDELTSEKINTTIDYCRVNLLQEYYRNDSFKFLEKELNN